MDSTQLSVKILVLNSSTRWNHGGVLHTPTQGQVSWLGKAKSQQGRETKLDNDLDRRIVPVCQWCDASESIWSAGEG